MTLKPIRVGRKVINLEYMILSEEWDGTPETEQLMPGGVRVTLETGRSLVFNAQQAEEFLRRLEEVVPAVKREVPCDPGQPGIASEFDTDTGQPR
jgi:hypothetical protein